MTAKTYLRSFAAGELSPQLFGRLDLGKFQTGVAKALNFLVTPQGPIENRPGFAYVNKAKYEDRRAVLIPFTYNSAQTFVVEFGVQYVRFHTNGATLLEAGKTINGITQASPGVFTVPAHGYQNNNWVFLASVGGMTSLSGRCCVVKGVTTNTFTLTDLFGNPISTAALDAYSGGGVVARVYELATPYLENDLFDLHYVQSADVMTICHPAYAPRELRRLSAASWQLSTISFLPTISTPAAPAAAAVGSSGTPEDHTYVCTAVAADTLEESLASPPDTVSNDLTTAGQYNEIQPSTVAEGLRYNVYKLKNGLYGYIGQTDGSLFKDNNITPDMLQTPPLANDPFAIGAITAVTVTAGGSGYGSVPQTGGAITAVVVTNGGAGYVAPAASAAGGGSGATFNVTEAAGVVTAVAVTNGGSLYVSPTITITDGGPGAGATATATASAIVDHVVTLTVTDSSGPGTGAVLEPVVIGGVITGVRVVAGGSGYVSPVVTVTDAAGGSGATFAVPTVTGSGVNPWAVSYFEQRRCFGGTYEKPQNIWMTRSGTERNMSYSIPTQDDDSIGLRIVAREAQYVRHLVPLNNLIALTSGGEWRIESAGSDALTPTSVRPKPQGYVGASGVQPVVTSRSVLYAPARGNHIRELSYRWETQAYEAEDVTIMAPHLFDYKTTLQMAYSKAPTQILWAVRNDGVLLGLTHVPEHEVKAWHQHTTAGAFESICAVAEGDEDGVYAVVRRTINGRSVRYIERMRSRQAATLADSSFLDAGATYTGAATSTITGLHHLEGAQVTVLADGGVEGPKTVTGGTITLDAPASKVHVGLPYNSDAQTLPWAYERAAALGQGSDKNINGVSLRMLASSGVKVGPSFDKLNEYPQRTTEPLGTAPQPVTGVVDMKLSPQWQQDGSLCIRQSHPLPLTLQALVLEVASGG